MNNQQAIEILKDFDSQVTAKADGAYQSTVGKMACDLAIVALKRQIPKKYKKTHPCKSVTYYQCPCCDGLLHINENFCGECGQAIDWSE